MKRFVGIALILALIVIGSGRIRSGEVKKEQVTADGIAAIMRNDVGAAKDKAVQNAQRNAVEQVVGTLVDSETLVQNNMLINDKIYTQTAGYVCGYKIISERSDNNNYYVTISACVEQGNLENNLLALNICIRKMGDPRTILMIGEQNVNSQKPQGWWQGSSMSVTEQAIMEEFMKKNLRLMDPMVASGKIARVKAVSEVSPEDATLIGKAVNAEFVVIGKALVACNDKDQYNFYNCNANINIRIIKVKTGEIFGTATASDKAAHIQEVEAGVRALRKAAEKVAPQLIKAVATICQKMDKPIVVMATNAVSLAKVKAFTAELGEIRGVKGVNRRSFGGGKAELEVTYEGQSSDLADAIEETGLASVTNIDSENIEVRLK